MNDYNQLVLLEHLDQLHTTDLGVIRVRRNLSLNCEDVVDWCRKQITSPDASIVRNGKNWYVDIGTGVITVNAYSYTIITAHKKKVEEEKHGENK